jgi:hypothetical protein
MTLYIKTVRSCFRKQSVLLTMLIKAGSSRATFSVLLTVTSHYNSRLGLHTKLPTFSRSVAFALGDRRDHTLTLIYQERCYYSRLLTSYGSSTATRENMSTATSPWAIASEQLPPARADNTRPANVSTALLARQTRPHEPTAARHNHSTPIAGLTRRRARRDLVRF